MIITKPLADKLWPGEDPIGKQLKTNYVSDAFMTVVGIVPEAQNWQDVGAAQNEVYTPLAQNVKQAGNGMSVVLRTRVAADAGIASAIRQRMRVIAPDMPVTIQTMTERIEDTAKDRRFAMMVLSGFAAVALALAALGIYGVVSYSVAVRTREIGVRMALGATSTSVLTETAGRAGFTAGIGVIVGLVAGVGATRALQSLLFGVVALDRTSFLLSAVILLCTAIAAALIPAYHSSRTDPLVSLRAD
jgi:ABC-type antimicrobial peptide transport system permease subunit